MRIFKDYKGRNVRLTDERVTHFTKRLIKAGLMDKIEETIANPDFVFESRTDPMAAIYYRYYRRVTAGDKYLCIVVKHERNDSYILTAYPSDHIKKGNLIWERNKK
jgi:hypothetical protein